MWGHLLTTALLIGGISQAWIPRPTENTRSDWQHKQAFDGARAFQYLVRQTSFGPRGPGLPGHDRCLKFLRTELGRLADKVYAQEFPYTTKSGKELVLTNLLASFNAGASRRVVLSAHWDTRLWADKDPDAANHMKPIHGANDGASGVAILLEVAQQLKVRRLLIGVDIILFDGEDLGTSGVPGSFCQGSRYFAKNKPQEFQAEFGINIDMVGDRELRIYREQNSERLAPEIQNMVFAAARELGIPQFIDEKGPEVSDDHLALNEIGIPTIDLIDFDYPDESNKFWHTLADTPDKCSAASLEAVGSVVLRILHSQS